MTTFRILHARLDENLRLSFGIRPRENSSGDDEQIIWIDDSHLTKPEYGTVTHGQLIVFLISLPSATLDAFNHCQAFRRDIQFAKKYQAQQAGEIPEAKDVLHVQTLTGKTLHFDYGKAQQGSVYDFKNMIQDREGIPPEQMRLIHGGCQMEDGRTLASYGVLPGAIIYLILRLRGAKPVIYLYPPGNLCCTVDLTLAPFWVSTHTYPVPSTIQRSHHINWVVDAMPNGDMDVHTHIAGQIKKTPYLFWEAETTGTDLSQPFPLENEHTMTLPRRVFLDYLEAVLVQHLFLDFKQAADMITWWLPTFNKLDDISFRFLSLQEINLAAPLNIVPAPDILHRVFLLFGQGSPQNGATDYKETDWDPIVTGGACMDGWKEDKFSVLEWGGMFIDRGHSRMSNPC